MGEVEFEKVGETEHRLSEAVIINFGLLSISTM